LNRSQVSYNTNSDYLKIYFFAHDNLIMTTTFFDWIGVIKNLLEEREFALIMRSLRYLKFKGEDTLLETISLLLLNTLNKVNSYSCIVRYTLMYLIICILDVK